MRFVILSWLVQKNRHICSNFVQRVTTDVTSYIFIKKIFLFSLPLGCCYIFD